MDLKAHTHSRGPRWEWMTEQKHVLKSDRLSFVYILKLIEDRDKIYQMFSQKFCYLCFLLKYVDISPKHQHSHVHVFIFL